MLKKRRVHFMGIGGSGCRGAAAICLSQGYEISGCDLRLDREGLGKDFKKIKIYGQHDSSHTGNIDILVVSPAVLSFNPQNKEVEGARKKNVPVITWQELVGREILRDKFVIAVCGTHGKSTTTAFLGAILEKASLDPTVLLGARVTAWGKSYRLGKSPYFVIEADEFNDNFLNYKPDIAAVGSLEFDHPEYFSTFEDILLSFEKFITNSLKKTVIVANSFDPGVVRLIQRLAGRFNLVSFTAPDPSLESNLLGRHNLFNATLAAQTARLLGVSEGDVIETVRNFSGLERRFEQKGQFKRALVFDDYAHHPTEVKVTLDAAHQAYPRSRLFCVLQPHMFSRTQALFGDFVTVFERSPCAKIIITDIFAARERDLGQVSSADLVAAIKGKNVEYIAGFSDIVKSLAQDVRPEDIVITMGAGDINQLAQMLVKE